MGLREEIRPTGGAANATQWHDQDLGDDWIASFRLDWTGTEYVIGELRVTHAAGSPSALGDPGLTARRLRDIRFEAALTAGRAEVERAVAESFPGGEAGWRSYVGRRRPRRSAWSDLDYAQLAADYTHRLGDGQTSAPVQELAQSRGYSPQRIKQLLAEARARGLLTSTAPRRAGGELTVRALELLAADAR